MVLLRLSRVPSGRAALAACVLIPLLATLGVLWGPSGSPVRPAPATVGGSALAMAVVVVVLSCGLLVAEIVQAECALGRGRALRMAGLDGARGMGAIAMVALVLALPLGAATSAIPAALAVHAGIPAAQAIGFAAVVVLAGLTSGLLSAAGALRLSGTAARIGASMLAACAMLAVFWLVETVGETPGISPLPALGATLAASCCALGVLALAWRVRGARAWA
jgi:hypothetical protein